jgi:hypothetical protein
MRPQGGAIHHRQLNAVGFDGNAIARLVRRGVLARRHQGVYIDALVPLSRRGELWAAFLAGGRDSFLSHRTALADYGACPLNLRAIEITVVTGHTPPRRGGLVPHRTTVAPQGHEVRVREGIRVASPSLALVQSAAGSTVAELTRLVAELERRRLLDLGHVDEALRRRGRTPGADKLRRALGGYRPIPFDESALERDFAAWLATLDHVPPPTRDVHLGPWQFDFHWPAHGVVVETDGPQYHRTPAELERDRVKDAWVQRQRLRILRVTGFRFAHDRPGIEADLRAMLDLHSRRP